MTSLSRLHDALSETAETPTSTSNRADQLQSMRSRVHKAVVTALEQDPALLPQPSANGDSLTADEVAHDHIVAAIERAVDADGHPVSTVERRRVVREIAAEVLGYGPIDQYLHDPSVTEVMVNGCEDVWIERHGRLQLTATHFVDDEHVMRIIDRIVSGVGRRIDESSPMVDARLPDGSRVNAIVPPLSMRGPLLTIRKFRRDRMTMKDLVRHGSLTNDAAHVLELCVRGAANVVISGGTGSGKTTLLNVLSASIPDSERIVTIEDAAELQLHQRHVLPLEARPENTEGRGSVTIRDLARNALRMRPDRIVVGEVRGAEAVDMLQAMNTGHDGSLTTIHANSGRGALRRLETLVMMSDVGLPSNAVREHIASALDLVVHVARLADGSRRVVEISEVGGMEGGAIQMQPLFVTNATERPGQSASGALVEPLHPTGIVPGFLPRLAINGVVIPESVFSVASDGL
jgi:pilus assembly protein CpaF